MDEEEMSYCDHSRTCGCLKCQKINQETLSEIAEISFPYLKVRKGRYTSKLKEVSPLDPRYHTDGTKVPYLPKAFPIPFPTYVAPDPTPEQIANAAKWSIDPEDRIGIGRWWSLSPQHPLAAAATIHDESYMYMLLGNERAAVDATFKSNCLILAEYAIKILELSEEYKLEAEVFPAIVFAASPFIDTSVDRNTDVTREQGRVFIQEADAYIARCAGVIRWGAAMTSRQLPR